MNLEGVCYWSSENAFIDRFKTSGDWGAYNGSTPVNTPVTLDANGYPTAMPQGANMLLSMFSVDPASAGTSNVYVLTYSGKADVTIGGGTVLSQEDGRITFRSDSSNGMDLVELTNMDAAHPVTAIHVVRQDQETLFNQGELFNPEFTDKMTGWDTLRYKDWANTDNSDMTSWSQRTGLNSASWSGSTTGKAGVPIEVQVALANETHTNMWVNVPAQADDDYVRQMMSYVHDHLDPALKVTLEYSNEVWNWGYQQAGYALQMGDKLWGTDANHDGTINSNDPAEHVQDGWVQYYGYRAAQVAAIAKSVFSDSAGRLQTAVATQTTFEGLENSIFTGAAKAGQGDAGHLFNVYAVTTYFGNELDGYNAADQAKVVGWAKAGSAGVDAAFRELEYGDQGFAGHLSLADLKGLYAYQAQVAAKNGMAMVAYEGGAHLTAAAFGQSDQALVSQFFETLLNDPRMGVLYAKMAADFAAAGGTELTAFQDTATPTQYGDWGVLSSIYDDGSPRYDALRAAQGLSGSANGSPALGTPANPIVVAGDASGALYMAGNLSDYVVAKTGAGALTLVSAGGAGQHYSATGVSEIDFQSGGTLSVSGNQLSLSGAGAQMVTGSGDADAVSLAGTTGAVTVNGGSGGDTITGGLGNDHIYGNSRTTVQGTADGADVITAGSGTNYVNGNAGDDIIVAGIAGSTGANRLLGGSGDDRITIRGAGMNSANGNVGNDVVDARDAAGNNLLRGGQGDDMVRGGHGQDQLFGDLGNDTLVAGTGAGHLQVMNGGSGADLFDFSSGPATPMQLNGITFYQDVQDLDLSADHLHLPFAVSGGHLLGTDAANFASVTAAQAYAQGLLASHAGDHDVVALSAGGDSYLFYDSTGHNGAIDSIVKLDHVGASSLSTALFQ